MLNGKQWIGLSVLALALPMGDAAAATLTSNDFSLGYGHRNQDFIGVWDDSETASANTPVTGDFSLDVTVDGTHWSGSGPTFPNRVLGNQQEENDFSGNSSTFRLTLTATYNGGAPVDSIQLELDSLSIYGAAYSGWNDERKMRFEETTVANAGTSDWITLTALPNSSTAFGTASNYTQLVWNPDDFWQAGTSVTRTFVITSDSGNARLIDGLEFSGRITAVPEPASAALVGVGTLLLARRRRTAKRPWPEND